jgi:hypothetical protein
MKIRLILALLFTFSLGTSIYYTKKGPAISTVLQDECCNGNPHIIIVPPTPTPTPQPGN